MNLIEPFLEILLIINIVSTVNLLIILEAGYPSYYSALCYILKDDKINLIGRIIVYILITPFVILPTIGLLIIFLIYFMFIGTRKIFKKIFHEREEYL